MGNMLKTMGKRAKFASWCESGMALGISLGVLLSVLVAPIRDLRAAESDRAARTAKFARPVAVPSPRKILIRRTRPNSGGSCFSTA
jgi:hypothetical protein